MTVISRAMHSRSDAAQNEGYVTSVRHMQIAD